MIASAVPAALAFLVTSTSLPIVMSLARRWNILDHPGVLKIHRRPICRLGGVSVALGIFAATVVFEPSSPSRNMFLAAMAVIWVTGLIDDIRNISPWTRLFLQSLASIIAWLGLRGAFSANTAVDCLLCLLWFLTYVNAFNFLDGSDSLAAGVASTLALFYATVFCLGTTSLGTLIALAMTGASVAFLARNWPPAQIFLGDSGSCVLGFGIAYASVTLFQSRDSIRASLLVPLICSALPLLDLAWAVIRRLGAGRSPMFGDRRHLPDLLLQRGWSARHVALSYCAATSLLAAVAWMALSHGGMAIIATALAVGVALSWMGYRLGVLRMTSEGKMEGQHMEEQRAAPERPKYANN